MRLIMARDLCSFTPGRVISGFARTDIPARAARISRLPPFGAQAGNAPRVNPNVHGARGLLALLVFFFHVASSGLPTFAILGHGPLHAALTALQFGVEIFFCISGYIVAGSLNKAGSVGMFLADRAVRILPVLWLSLAVIVPLGLLTHQGVFAGLTHGDLAWVVPVNLLMLPGVLPLPVLHMAAWSLSYEFLFYLIAAALWSIPAERRALRMLVLGVSLALVAWHPRAIFFGIGALVARVDPLRHPLLGQAARWPLAMLTIFLALWFEVQFGNGEHGDGTLVAWAHDGRIGLAAVAVSAAIVAFAGIVAGHGPLGRVLRSRPSQWIGMVSYSFYLWQLIVMAVVKRGMSAAGLIGAAGDWSQLLLVALALPLSLALAYASARLIEQRLSRWLRQHCHAYATRFNQFYPIVALSH